MVRLQLRLDKIIDVFLMVFLAIEVRQDNALSHSDFGNNVKKKNSFLVLKP